MEMESRNYGIDLLRIISMMLVIVLHINTKGGILTDHYLTVSYDIALFMQIAAIGAVDIYALISGYVGYGRESRSENIIRLWINTVFYCLMIDLVFLVCYDEEFMSIGGSITALFPVTREVYWYLTAYTAVFVFMSVLDHCLDKMDKKMAFQVVMSGLLLSWWDLLSKKDIFKLNGGYSPVWLVFLYFIGAYVRKYHSERSDKDLYRKYCGRIYILLICVSFIMVVILQKITLSILGKAKGDRFFIGYTTPGVVIASIVLLMYFSSIKIKHQNAVRFFSTTTFSVYLIYNHPLVGGYLMPKVFERFVGRSAITTVLVFMIGPIAIFVVAALVDKIRDFLFMRAKIYSLITKTGKYIDRVIIHILDKSFNILT